MGFLTWDDVVSVNEQTGTMAGKLAKKAGTQICTWYRKYPGLWSIQPGQGAFLNQVCPPLGQPPTGGFKTFTGGQCTQTYSVYWRYGNTSGAVPTMASGTNIAGLGAVSGPLQSVNTSVSGTTGTLTVVDKNGNTLTASGPYGPADRVRKLFVNPPSGGTDNCGDPPVKPLPTDQPIDNNDFDFNFTIENSNNNQTTNYNDLHFTYVRPPNITFPIKVDIGGIKFDLDLPGVHFDDSPPTNDDLDNDIKEIGDKLDDLGDKIDNFKPCEELPSLDDLDPETDEEIEEKEEEDPTIEAVLIDVLELPKKGKTIILPNQEDNTFFAGYFSWTLNGYREPEQPIRKSKNAFIKPHWATGYRVYTVNLATISVTVYKST